VVAAHPERAGRYLRSGCHTRRARPGGDVLLQQRIAVLIVTRPAVADARSAAFPVAAHPVATTAPADSVDALVAIAASSANTATPVVSALLFITIRLADARAFDTVILRAGADATLSLAPVVTAQFALTAHKLAKALVALFFAPGALPADTAATVVPAGFALAQRLAALVVEARLALIATGVQALYVHALTYARRAVLVVLLLAQPATATAAIIATLHPFAVHKHTQVILAHLAAGRARPALAPATIIPAVFAIAGRLALAHAICAHLLWTGAFAADSPASVRPALLSLAIGLTTIHGWVVVRRLPFTTAFVLIVLPSATVVGRLVLGAVGELEAGLRIAFHPDPFQTTPIFAKAELAIVGAALPRDTVAAVLAGRIAFKCNNFDGVPVPGVGVGILHFQGIRHFLRVCDIGHVRLVNIGGNIHGILAGCVFAVRDFRDVLRSSVGNFLPNIGRHDGDIALPIGYSPINPTVQRHIPGLPGGRLGQTTGDRQHCDQQE